MKLQRIELRRAMHSKRGEGVMAKRRACPFLMRAKTPHSWIYLGTVHNLRQPVFVCIIINYAV